MAICLTDEIDKIVRDEKLQEWGLKKKIWFVIDHDDPWDLRCPGKFKSEWTTKDGALIWFVLTHFYNFEYFFQFGTQNIFCLYTKR